MIGPFRVSHIKSYARFLKEDSLDVGWLVNEIRGGESTPSQERGTAFHAALEKIGNGDHSVVSAMGHTFAFTCDVQISLPKIRETRQHKDYGAILISGQCDGIIGKEIIDHKTTSTFDAENYFDSWQFKYYLDIFGADVFQWHIWEVKELDAPHDNVASNDGAERVWEVYAHHLLTQCRYPDLERDCRELALEFRDFITANHLEWTLKRKT